MKLRKLLLGKFGQLFYSGGRSLEDIRRDMRPISGGAVAPFEIIAGPANVWVAPYAEPFPAINATPGVNWFAFGYTDGGIQITHPQNIEEIYVDQVPTPVKLMRTTESVVIEFAIAQMTIEKIAKILNDAAVTTTGTPQRKEISLFRGVDVKTLAMIVRGPSPYLNAANAQYQVPLVVQTEDPSTTYQRDDKSTYSSQWTALGDLALPDADKLGKLLAQSA